MPLVARTARLATGVALPYVECGDPAGVPVVLLHGITDSWRSFEPVLPRIPERLHVVAVSQRGHAGAVGGEGYLPADYARDVVALADALGLGPLVLVGHSMGASVAHRFVLDEPDRVRGLVLVSAFAAFRTNCAMQELHRAVRGLADPIDPQFVREFQLGTIAQPVPDAFVDLVVAESLKAPARVWRAALEGLMGDDPIERPGKILAPTLIVWGDRDALVPEPDAGKLAAAIPNARILVYAGAGHALHWEEPERFASDLVRFVEDTAPGKPLES